MDKPSQIKRLLQGIAGTDKQAFHFRIMTVTGVDGDTCRARIGGEGIEIPDIRLCAIPGGGKNGLIVTPAVGSVILVADLSCGLLRDLAAVGFSEIESVRLHLRDQRRHRRKGRRPRGSGQSDTDYGRRGGI